MDSCTEIAMGPAQRQRNFPLCWFMAPVVFLYTLTKMNPVLKTLLHKSVVDFVSEWGSGRLEQEDPFSLSCPMINPPDLRRYLSEPSVVFTPDASIEPLYKLQVTIFKSHKDYVEKSKLYQIDCIKGDKLSFVYDESVPSQIGLDDVWTSSSTWKSVQFSARNMLQIEKLYDKAEWNDRAQKLIENAISKHMYVNMEAIKAAKNPNKMLKAVLKEATMFDCDIVFEPDAIAPFLTTRPHTMFPTTNFDKCVLKNMNEFSYPVDYTDNIVDAILAGKHYFNDHYLCLTKFKGQSSVDEKLLIEKLLCYDGVLAPNKSKCKVIKVKSQSEGPKKVANLVEKPDFLIVESPEQDIGLTKKFFNDITSSRIKYLFHSYKPLGGLLGLSDHLTSFVMCTDVYNGGFESRFMDTNGKVTKSFGEMIEWWTQKQKKSYTTFRIYFILQRDGAFTVSDDQTDSDFSSLSTLSDYPATKRRRTQSIQDNIQELFS